MIGLMLRRGGMGLALCAWAGVAMAQQGDTTHKGDTTHAVTPTPIPTNPAAPTLPSPTDSLHRDSTKKVKPLVTWADSDSIVARLMSRPGYRATRYQGDTVIFDAQRRGLVIRGKPSAVGRDQTLILGDTLIFNDSTRILTALGDTIVLHDPTQQSADVIAHKHFTYSMDQRRGAITNLNTSVTSGSQYYVSGRNAVFVGDTSKAKANLFYVRDGIITSCDDSIPDYYFASKDIKYVSKHLIVARPATLYVAGVPVFWLPFLFQDIRTGRQSGLLIPRFGLSDFIRTSSSYRRQVDNVGYYANMGDYMDGLAWLDWRSSAGASEGDPGYLRYNGEFRYHWLDRFVTGSFAFNQLNQGDGSSNTAVSWYHSQDFSQTSHLISSINYVTNTTVQRSQAVDPVAALATIRSDVRYSRQVGPFSLDVGGTRTQYPGRTEVEENYPNVSISSPTLSVSKWLDWTPGFNYTRQATANNDQAGTFGKRYFMLNGVPDSVNLKGSSNNSSYNLNTPFSILGFQISANVSAQSQNNNFPVVRTFINPTDTSLRFTRTYARSYVDGFDWNFGFSLPGFLDNTFRVRPNLSFQNVYGGSYWIRTELSDGAYVHQSKRPIVGISMSPTLFALFPGFGPFARIRHSITPSIQFNYSPSATVDSAYLAALNENPSTFLGALPQRQVSLSLSQVFEARFRDTSAAGEGKKIRLLSVNFSPLVYDFERAHVTHRTGLVTNDFSYNLASDLLPGFSFRSDYSLFQGDINSDTARFSPFRQSMSASFTLNGQTGIFAAISKLLGHPVSSSSTTSTSQSSTGPQVDSLQGLSSFPAAGTYAQNHQYVIPNTQGWSTSITFTSQRQRPPRGGTVVSSDPSAVCQQFQTNPGLYDQCQQNALLAPVTTGTLNDPIAGGIVVLAPSQENIAAQSTFHITENWAATWGTVYDAVRHEFASQQVTLQRELHDWRAIFSFTSSPNGNFYFSFSIANKAQPELRFPYTKSTYRQATVP